MAIIKKRYYTIDGEMIGYKDASGRKDFLTDALGSVTAEVNQTGSVKTFDGRYKPFGETLWSVGIKGIFGWFGAWGYRNVGLSSNSHYVRYRHYSMSVARWTTPDPLFDLLRMKSRGRVRGTPLSLGRGYKIKEPWRHPDYFGLQPGIPPTYSGIEPGGWLGTPGIGGDVGLDNCLHFMVPIPLEEFGGELEIVFDFCKQSFDTTCCKPPAEAQECTQLKFGAALILGFPEEFLDLNKEEQELRGVLNMLVAMFGGVGNLGLGGIKQRGCPKKESEFKVEICLEACGGLASASICLEFAANGITLTVNEHLGICGLPRLEVSIKGVYDQCS